jgi:energy-coupling factor transport system permease protein
MDWLRQLPIGQFVAEEQGGRGSWLRQLDPRLKLAWTLAFLITPILAGSLWRLSLVGLLLLVTAASGLPWRLWRRSLPALIVLAVLVGLLSAVLPEGSAPAAPLLAPSPPPARLRPPTLPPRRVR